MDEISAAPTTLREALETNFEAAEQAQPIAQQVAPEVENESTPSDSRARDDKGRFAQKAEEPPQEAKPEAAPEPAPARPTTWKKEYLPLWEKLHAGLPLTPEESRKVAEYSGIQREKEFASGVSTYKAEATNAKALQDAIAPFMPDLQAHNINPSQWISNLGNAHKMLVMGTPEQKLQMFGKLAQEYGVPLAAIATGQQGQLDPIVPQLMQQIQQLSGQVNTVANWRQQQEMQQIQQQLAPFQDATKYPHFEIVRNDMALLLESGKAQDLDAAYKLAVRLNDDAWQAENERQAQAASQAQAAKQAKSRAVSVKSATPTGQASTGAKDRRSILAEQLDAVGSGRL